MHEPTAYTSKTIESVKNRKELLGEYIEVSKRLHGEDFLVTDKEFEVLLTDEKEIVSFVLIDGKLVATAQASLHHRFPYFEAFINNVVTHPEYGGRGLGRIVMDNLEDAISVQWGENAERKINLLLSNSPAKGNGGFYEKLGWTSRGPDSASPTTMWVKTI